jgi:putative endonuclease
MPFYVYIIQSQKDRSYYKGFTENPPLRVERHNNRESHYTSAKIPWTLVYVEELETKKLALIREKSLKKYSNDQILGLLKTSKNIVDYFRKLS